MEKILLLSDYSLDNKAVADLTRQNHMDYAARWGLDVLYAVKPYSPHVDWLFLRDLLKVYPTVITVGTDILFTDFRRDIREFFWPRLTVTIQEERTGGGLNGDFIIWNRTDTAFNELEFCRREAGAYRSTQDEFNALRHRLRLHAYPCRTIQSINPAAYSGSEAAWRPGDFAVHCHRPNRAPVVAEKVADILEFLRKYPINQ